MESLSRARIDADIARIAKAIRDDDDEAVKAGCLGLLATTLCDISRIADALEVLAAPPVGRVSDGG